VGDVRTRVGDDVVGRSLLSVSESRSVHRSPHLASAADDGALRDCEVLLTQFSTLDGIDVLAAGDDHILEAVDG